MNCLERSDISFMTLALNEAQKAYDSAEVPVGAVIVSVLSWPDVKAASQNG